MFRLVLLLCVFALLACSNRKHRNQTQSCLFAGRLFLAGLFLVRLMYRVCIANMPFRHFLEHCLSDKKSKQVRIQNAMCFLRVCFSVGFAVVCFCFKYADRLFCLFADRLFLAGLFLVRLMYRVCIANMPFRHFFEHCFSSQSTKS